MARHGVRITSHGIAFDELPLLLELGDHDAARGAMASAVDAGLLRAPRSFSWGTTMLGAADVCASLEDRSLAARLYELLAPVQAS